ncbi:hypothetical protein HPB51_024712 [Rhipicephalus microplus]|uniref:THAP-type domain-containing protein n=1 Tax=Rhipicephalus microplus TaxID=6941 RepID=A0A9J6EVG7_RHIMP|nr:hypothetical protein HPB51_024712 [Rhipicephalus microplus]
MPADDGDSGIEAMSLPESRETSPKMSKRDLDVAMPTTSSTTEGSASVVGEDDDLDVSELPSFTMPTCFVPGCTSGYKSNPEKRHFFAPPSDPQLLERWVRAIPRADKLLSKTCKVCDVHFMQHDIVKTYKHAIDGQVVEIDRGCWALQPEAVPCQFPNVPSYLSKTIKRRRSPKDRASLPNKVVLVATPSDEYQQEVPDPVHDIDFAQIVENGSSLKLPKNWRMADLEEDTGKPRQVIFYKAGMKDDVYAILKSVAIHEDLTYVIHANGRLLRSWDAEINIFSAQDVEAIVQIVHAKQFCRGCPLIDVTNSSRVTKKVGGRLHHNDCAVLTDADKEVCAACANLTKSLKRKATSTRSKRKVPVAASALRKRLIRATAARERKKADVKHLSEKLKNHSMPSQVMPTIMNTMHHHQKRPPCITWQATWLSS